LLFAFLLNSAPAFASDDHFEVWLNPSVTAELDDDTSVEFETAQRLRSADSGGVDTYFARVWINQKLDSQFTISAAAGRRINDGGADELRFHQQVTYRSGILRGRLRLEQRLVDDAERMGLRLRPRIGVSVPLDEAGDWTGFTDAEGFLTLRSTDIGGQNGLTGIRTQIGVRHDLTDSIEVGLAYLRQQDIRDGRADRVGHAPLLSLEIAL
jgi:hypothetical protein